MKSRKKQQISRQSRVTYSVFVQTALIYFGDDPIYFEEGWLISGRDGNYCYLGAMGVFVELDSGKMEALLTKGFAIRLADLDFCKKEGC